MEPLTEQSERLTKAKRAELSRAMAQHKASGQRPAASWDPREPYLVVPATRARGAAMVVPGIAYVDGLTNLSYDYAVTVAIEGADHPRAVVAEMTVKAREGGGGIAGRQVAAELAAVKLEAVKRLTRPMREDGRPGRRKDATPGMARAAVKAAGAGPPGVPLAELEKAARLYRKAQAQGRPTTAAVAAGLRVSESTAKKRVGMCRHPEVGLLPETGGTTRPKL